MAGTVAVPTFAHMLTVYADDVIDLGADLLAIFLLAFVLYFRRHRRADLLLAYVALNIGIFVAMSLLSRVRVDIALGFGLFAILSIIRLRSSAVTQQEVAYYFVALVLGLVNGLGLDDRWLLVMATSCCCATMLVVDSNRCASAPGAWTSPWTWSTPTTPRWSPTWSAGWAGGVCTTSSTRSTTCARPCSSTCATGPARSWLRPSVDERPIEVTLDVVHADDAALVADLEHRLGGQVLRHQVKDIDYVRDTMVVDVRYRGRVAAPPSGRLDRHGRWRRSHERPPARHRRPRCPRPGRPPPPSGRWPPPPRWSTRSGWTS